MAYKAKGLDKISKAIKEIKPVNPKGNPSWILIGSNDVEAEALVLWPPDMKSWLIGNDPDAGKDWRQKEKWMTEDEMVGWHHQLNAYEFEQTLGDSEGQGSLVSCSPWGCRVGLSDWTISISQKGERHPSIYGMRTWRETNGKKKKQKEQT